MASAAVVLVGSEMLDPARRDANGPCARAALAEIGIPLAWTARVGDRIEDIKETLETALSLCEIVIVSGGLGPTGDDVTREGAAALLGVGLKEDEAWLGALRARLEERGRKLTELGRRQALVVESAEPIPNGPGLACGSWLKHGERDLILLPGVPPEFRWMMEEHVRPRLKAAYSAQPSVRTVRAVAAGIAEVDAEVVLKPWYGQAGIDVSILPQRGVHRITFTLASPPIPSLAAAEARVREALASGLGDHLISLEGVSLEASVGLRLLEKGWTLATAESCTGGLIGHQVVRVPGASRYFLGGVVAYDNAAKVDLLGVPSRAIEENGAVSREVALAMARGAKARLNASCAVATTGIAGPTGGTPEKPVGTVWVAAATPVSEKAVKLGYPVNRESVMALSANYALFLLLGMLR